MKGIIYKATNTFNGKVYIGQTIAGLPKRKQQHYQEARADSDNIFHVALYQYPKESFSWEVIEEFNGSRMNVSHSLNVAEEYHIMKCNSTDERYGYNSTHGGYLSNKFSKQVRERQIRTGGQAVAMLQYDKDGNFVREFSSLNEVSAYLGKEKLSKTDLITGLHYGHQWRVKENEYFPREIGRYYPNNGVKPPSKIIVYDKDGVFLGRFMYAADVERITGVKKNIILSRSCGKIPCDMTIKEHQAKDYYFFRDADNYPKQITITIQKKKRVSESSQQIASVPVLAYDAKTGEFVREFPSISEAHNVSGAATQTISYYIRRSAPYTIISPLTKYVWVKKEGKIQQFVEVKPFIKKQKNTRKKMEHRVIQYTLDGEFVKIWDNANQAAEIGEDNQNIIRKSLKGLSSMKSPNYQWRYYTPDYKEKIEPYQHVGTTKAGRPKKTTHQEESLFERQDDTIEEVAWDGTVIATYKDTADAAKQSGFSQAYICNVLAGRIKHPKRKFRRI